MQSCPTLCEPMDCSHPPGSSVHGDSPGKNAGVGCHALFQGIFPTQGCSPGLPHCRRNLYHLSHQGSPRILEWVAYPFCSGSSRPRNWTGVSGTAGRFFTILIHTSLSYERSILITLHKTSACLRDNSTHLYKFIPITSVHGTFSMAYLTWTQHQPGSPTKTTTLASGASQRTISTGVPIISEWSWTQNGS